MFKVSNINDLELLYSVLREEYPNQEIDITFNYNKKEYSVKVSNKPYKGDPNVPVDLKIEVVYGDSVTASTPLILRDPITQHIYIKTIGCLWNATKAQEYPEFKIFDKYLRLEKQYCQIDFEVWTDGGWSQIQKVIRHKSSKMIHRTHTQIGIVDVTEDHSLLTDTLQKITPKETHVGTKLLHSFPTTFENSEKSFISIEKGLLYGIYISIGTIKNGHVQFDTCNDKQLNLLRNLLKVVYPEEHFTQEGYCVLSKSQNMFKIFQRTFYENNNDSLSKIVPTIILNSSRAIIETFLQGIASCSCTDYKQISYMSFEHQITCQGVYFLLKKLGFSVSLLLRDSYTLYYSSQQHQTTDIGTVVNIHELRKTKVSEYVYDLETASGRFGAGVGEIVTKNTDSVFLRFKFNRDDFDQNRVDTFRLATLCGDKLTQEKFKRPPIELEFEKVFQPFILLTKKRYIAHKYENMKDPFQLKGLDAKGIALTRRDYCNMVKKCYRDVIDTIMKSTSSSIHDSIEVFKSYVERIHRYDIDIEELVVSAMLAKSYKTRPVHVILAEKLKERKEEVQIGDRIPYIYVESSDPKLQKSELGEDPQYAIKNGLKFNRVCYLEQLAKPILGFYKIVLKDDHTLLDELIDYVNRKLVSYGAKGLKPSDFKLED
jgi:hypothetical protein